MKYITKVKREIGILEGYEKDNELTIYGKNRLKDLKEFRDAFEKLNLPVVVGRSAQLKSFMKWHRQGFNTYNKMSITQVVKEYKKTL